MMHQLRRLHRAASSAAACARKTPPEHTSPRCTCSRARVAVSGSADDDVNRVIERARERVPMEDQLGLVDEAMQRAQLASSAAPLSIEVSRVYGDSTVTLRAQLSGTRGRAAPPPAGKTARVATRSTSPHESMPLASLGLNDGLAEDSARLDAGPDVHSPPRGALARTYTTNSFYEESTIRRRSAEEEQEQEVSGLLAEIERLKRKALSRGVNLTSPHEDVPAEDVAMLRQVFAIADSDGDGEILLEQLGQLHTVLGEPLTADELGSAFKAMDANRSGTVSFEDFLAWYTLAHSSSGMLSKKGSAYTARFKKIMQQLSTAFDIKQLTTAKSGEPCSLDFRVAFHYNDQGQLKEISPWHDIPLFSKDGKYVHMVTEIPKFSRKKFEIATGEHFNPIKQDTKNGKLREYNYGDMVFNYGAFPQTWEDPAHTTPDTGHPGDNDPIDAVEIGSRILRTGSVTKVKVLGCLAMIDDGETDWKVICIAHDDPLAPKVHDISDVEQVLPGYIGVMREWLRKYKVIDGKPQNEFGLEEKAMGKEYTMRVIGETHDFWKKLVGTGRHEV